MINNKVEFLYPLINMFNFALLILLNKSISRQLINFDTLFIVFNVDINRPYQVIAPHDDKEPVQSAGRCCRIYKHSSGASSGVSKCVVSSHLQLLLFTGMSFESWIKDLVYKKKYLRVVRWPRPWDRIP